MVRKLGSFLLRLLHIPLLFKVLLIICAITALLALAGTVIVVHHSIERLIDPVEISTVAFATVLIVALLTLFAPR